ncbi:MAG: type II secretion system F family protein [Clostridia bacterium]|nr:type II secretion system F family protein [Clostridia bacterium]
MRKYKYTAVNVEKKKFIGSFVAENEEHLRQQLAQQNLYLISCKPIKNETPNPFFSLSGKIEIKELTTFCRQFAIMLNAGISILESLNQLKQQKFTGYFKSLLYIVYDDVKVGLLLSQAMEKHKKIFPEFFRSMIYVGEVSGNLEQVLISLADYYDNEIVLKKKIKGALSYPIIMGIMLVGVVSLMLLFIVPKFQDTLSKMEIDENEYNVITKVIFVMSEWLIANGLKLVYTVVGVVAVIFFGSKTERGKVILDTLKYKLPVIKNVQINMVASKFVKSLGLLLASGMNMADALEVVQHLLGNRYAEKEFKNIVNDVRQGASLTFAMDQYKIFPQILVQMISTGEKTGGVEEILGKTMKFFDSQVEDSLLKATGMIQPVMLAVMGLVIGVMFIAIYSPMLTIMQKNYA